MKIDDRFYDELLEKAAGSERKRMNYDLRNSSEDGSQRMLNAILPESVVLIHRHRDTSESVVCLQGNVTEIFFEEIQDSGFKIQVRESARYELSPGMMCQIPKGVWHTIIAHEASVIFEAKDGAYRPLSEDEVM